MSLPTILCSVSLENTTASKWDESTWHFLWDLAKEPSRTGVGAESLYHSVPRVLSQISMVNTIARSLLPVE